MEEGIGDWEQGEKAKRKKGIRSKATGKKGTMAIGLSL
jgi:hypothetical protein